MAKLLDCTQTTGFNGGSLMRNCILTLILPALLWLMGSQGQLHAQPLLLTATADPPAAITDDLITITAIVANESISSSLRNVQVTVQFSESVDFNSASNSIAGGTAGASGNAILYGIANLGPQEDAVLTLEIFANVTGPLTIYYDYSAANVPVETEEVVVPIFDQEANLGVVLYSNTNAVVTGDQFTYRLTVTNAGPDRVRSATVTADWPIDTEFVSINPAIRIAEEANGIRFDTDALNAGDERSFEIVIQPGSAVTNQLVALIENPDFLDPDQSDNASTNALVVVEAEPVNVTIIPVTGQTFNPQTGLMEQTFRVTNNETFTIDATRLLIESSEAVVFNAAGTNRGIPFATVNHPLAPNESADVVLEYFNPERSAVADPTFSSYSVPTAMPDVPDGIGVKTDMTYQLGNGTALIEFTSTPGQTYAIVYDDTVDFSNATPAIPLITAPANRVQWIDAGPPKTNQRPGAAPARFYRVIELTD